MREFAIFVLLVFVAMLVMKDYNMFSRIQKWLTFQ